MARFRHVTWPLLAPALTINTVVLLITAFKAYDQIQVITNGGPGTGTTATVAFLVLQTGFIDNHQGYASAMAVVMLLIVAVASAVRPARAAATGGRPVNDRDATPGVRRRGRGRSPSPSLGALFAVPLYVVLANVFKPGADIAPEPGVACRPAHAGQPDRRVLTRPDHLFWVEPDQQRAGHRALRRRPHRAVRDARPLPGPHRHPLGPRSLPWSCCAG